MPRSAHRADVETVLAHRRDNGGDYWASADGRIYVGNPYSTIAALGVLHELGVGRKHEAVAGGQSKLDPEGAVIVEHAHRGLKELRFCAKGQPSTPATKRYEEILGNPRA